MHLKKLQLCGYVYVLVGTRQGLRHLSGYDIIELFFSYFCQFGGVAYHAAIQFCKGTTFRGKRIIDPINCDSPSFKGVIFKCNTETKFKCRDSSCG